MTARKAQRWEYLTVYVSGALEFPDAVSRHETLAWAGKSITQQLNEIAARGWEVIDLRWLSDIEVMVIFKRRARTNSAGQDTE